MTGTAPAGPRSPAGIVSSLAHRVRPWLPPEVRVVRTSLRTEHRDERRLVERNLELPTTLPRARRGRGSVWGIAMMRNEADTAPHVVKHLFDQDLDALIVADNESTDATPDVLAELATTHPVYVVRDRLRAYTQATKMGVLAGLARRAGADWIVPFDADELWFAEHTTVGRHLRSSVASVVRAQLHNVFAGPDDDAGEADPFLRMGQIDPEPAPFCKVAFRTGRFVRLEMGNVDVIRRGRRIDGLFIAHYPWRSFEHLAGKLRHGRAAMAETRLADEIGEHWRKGGAWSDDRLAATWRTLCAGLPVPDLVWSPVGELRTAAPGRARTWSDVVASADLRLHAV